MEPTHILNDIMRQQTHLCNISVEGLIFAILYWVVKINMVEVSSYTVII